MELFCHHWGARHASKTKLLLLHGVGGTGALWRPIAANLESDYDILAPDQRGHGQSLTASSSYSPLDYGQDLVETLEALNFSPVWAVGHSMGVRTACALTHLRPDLVRGLVLVDLGFYGIDSGGYGEALVRFIKILPEEFKNRAEARAFMETNSPDPSISQYLMAVSISKGETLTFPFDHKALINTIVSARNLQTRDWVREAATRGLPILALRGELSRAWSRQDYEQEISAFKDLPNVVFEEVAGTGHGLPFEKRTEFVTRLRSFVGEQSGY